MSRQVKFQAFYKNQLAEIRKQVAVYGDDGNTTEMRARKRIRALAREVARLAIKEVN